MVQTLRCLANDLASVGGAQGPGFLQQSPDIQPVD
jgi:hypothetical protein